MTQHTPLLTLSITSDGRIEIEPGEGFTEDHLDLLVRAHAALVSALATE